MMTPWGQMLTAQDVARDPYRYAQQIVDMRRSQGLEGKADAQRVAEAAMTAAMPRMTFRSQVSPDYTYDPRLPAGGAEPSLALQVMKPAVILHTPAGDVTYAPYGKPKLNLFPLMVVLTVAGAGAIGWYAAQGVRGRRRR